MGWKIDDIRYSKRYIMFGYPSRLNILLQTEFTTILLKRQEIVAVPGSAFGDTVKVYFRIPAVATGSAVTRSYTEC